MRSFAVFSVCFLCVAALALGAVSDDSEDDVAVSSLDDHAVNDLLAEAYQAGRSGESFDEFELGDDDKTSLFAKTAAETTRNLVNAWKLLGEDDRSRIKMTAQVGARRATPELRRRRDRDGRFEREALENIGDGKDSCAISCHHVYALTNPADDNDDNVYLDLISKTTGDHSLRIGEVVNVDNADFDGKNIVDLALSPDLGLLFFVVIEQDSDSFAAVLYELNPCSAIACEVHRFDDVREMAIDFDPKGRLYILQRQVDDSDIVLRRAPVDLSEIDSATATIGPVHLCTAQHGCSNDGGDEGFALAIDAHGNAYYSRESRHFRLDLSNAQKTQELSRLPYASDDTPRITVDSENRLLSATQVPRPPPEDDVHVIAYNAYNQHNGLQVLHDDGDVDFIGCNVLGNTFAIAARRHGCHPAKAESAFKKRIPDSLADAKKKAELAAAEGHACLPLSVKAGHLSSRQSPLSDKHRLQLAQQKATIAERYDDARAAASCPSD